MAMDSALHRSASGPSMLEMVQLPDSSWCLADSVSESSMTTHKARLFLSEFLDEQVEQSLKEVSLDLPPDFLEMHNRDAAAVWEPPPPSVESLFAKWATPVTQLRQQRDIEQRIDLGKPYDADTVRDPSELRLDHARYERIPPFPVRPCHPVSSLDSGQEVLSLALTECVSIHFNHVNGVAIGKSGRVFRHVLH